MHLGGLTVKPPAPVALFQVDFASNGGTDRGRLLADVIRHIERTHKPRPWTETDQQPGQWVTFKNRVCCAIHRDPAELNPDEPGPPALLFWDRVLADEAAATPTDSTRLLLHG